MPSTDNVKLESVLDALSRLVAEIQADRVDRQRLLDKVHDLANNVLANAAAENKLAAVAERQLATIGAQAKAIQDLPEVVETQGYSLIADVRVLLTDVRAALQVHLDGDERRMAEVRAMFVSIERAAAIAANDAGDAKSAAFAAREATGPQRLADKGGDGNLVGLAKLVLGPTPSNARLLLVALLLVVLSLAGGTGLGGWFHAKVSGDTVKLETTTRSHRGD